MLPLEHPDRIHIAFDDHRLVANAGLLLPATPWLSAWVWVKWLTGTWTWVTPPAGPTPATS